MRDDRERALAAGCTDYISKPFEITDLLAMLARYTPSA
jgi:CheY-like chemotaxis protein